jgi:hypothetical protein
MTAPVLADRGLLAALAIAYGKAGIGDRPGKLQHAGAHVGRELTSTSELTAGEARNLRRHVPRCTADCPAFAVAALTSLTCACSTGGRVGQPSPCDPNGAGRYCPRSICWCGSCPWWKPAPEPNYATALAGPTDTRTGSAA